MQDNYTTQHREAIGALLKCFVDEMVDGIASSRKLDRKAVRIIAGPESLCCIARQQALRQQQLSVCTPAAGQESH